MQKQENNGQEIALRFGAAAPTFASQLKSQGFKYDAEKMKYYQEIGKHIWYLRIHSIASHCAAVLMEKRLYKLIRKHVLQYNQK